MIGPGFIEAGLAALRDALETAAETAGLILRRYRLTRTAARAFRAKVRQLETVLRRLVVLMAADIEIANINPLTPAQAGVSSSQTAPSQDTRAHPEPSRRTGPRGFILIPNSQYDPEKFEALRALSRGAPALVDETPLVHRYDTLRALIENPHALARRMARHLARWKAAGDSRPHCPAQPGLHRLSAELGAIASLLPRAVNDSLKGWYDSG
ncbi:hypothetical protein [Henriciella marina]|uniref:hypothetical protein n=1 Tax=Henriciella marina TaxID=453851 RepID=UPI00038247FD|nr:hypothetical protein [Henriciella marina]